MKLNLRTTATLGAVTLALATTAFAADNTSPSWLDNTISPVSNPILFEDAKINSEIHPVYMYHILPNSFDFVGGPVALGGKVQVMAVQARYAVNDKLAIIATKDGYIQFQPDNTLGHSYGWADLAAGLKYNIYRNDNSQVLVTPGLTITIPTGNRSTLQGHGAGVEDVFVSAEKGFDKFHLLGNLGFRIPNNFATDTAQIHYSLQADYYVHQYFIPFVALNGYTVLTKGSANILGGPVALNTEMYDLINAGSTAANGRTQLTLGGGIRSRLLKNLDVGCAYEAGIVKPVGIFAARVTADVVWRF
jgi:hypothetical protein